MKAILKILILPSFLLAGCVDDTSILTTPDLESNHQSNTINWVKLPAGLKGVFGVETEYSAQELIRGKDGGNIKLNFRIKRPGHSLGDFEINATVRVEKYSFPDDEVKLFTVTMDPENAFLNITPSPNTLFKHVIIDWEIKGIDVAEINPETFDFVYIGDNNEILETTNQQLKINYRQNKIKLKKAYVYPATTEITPQGVRYAFIR